MRILAFDTSTSVASVAIVCDGEPVIQIDTCVQVKHGETLLPRIEATLKEARLDFSDIDLIAVGVGPGSFTGIRVALATAKGLVFATQKPFVGVDSLRTLARGAVNGTGYLGVVTNAYRGEVYQAVFAADFSGQLSQVLTPMHAPPKDAAERLLLAIHGKRIRVCGDGARKYFQQFKDVLGESLELADPSTDVVRAANLALEAERLFNEVGPSDLVSIEPLYVRPSDAVLPKESL
jgi:tRNA threonylcarbamoyladenosine biosynthesis protein TsaB